MISDTKMQQEQIEKTEPNRNPRNRSMIERTNKKSKRARTRAGKPARDNGHLNILWTPPRKVRPSSILGTLPEDKKARIAALLESQSYDAVRQILARGKINVSIATLRRFRKLRLLHDRQTRHEALTAALVAKWARENPDLTETQLFDYGLKLLSRFALEDRDAASWSLLQRLRLEERRVRAIERRTAVLNKQAEQTFPKVKDRGGLSPDTLSKIENELNLL